MTTGRVRVDGPADFGVTGDLTRLKPRADFVASDFERLIDAQGARLAWARAIRCPCRPKNAQTAQPDPQCPRCNGRGWDHFGPASYAPPVAVGELDTLQQALVEQYSASVIRGVLYGASKRDEPYNTIGPWAFGKGMVTVRPDNVLAYYDRLVDLDSEIAYSEVITLTAAGRPAVVEAPRTRFPVLSLNRAITESGTVIAQGNNAADLRLTHTGALEWVTPAQAPRAGTRVALHYLCHAHWRVMDHPHVIRRTQTRIKVKQPTTPLGSPVALPLQAAIQLEQLTEEPSV